MLKRGELYYAKKRSIRNSSASPVANGDVIYFTDERGKTAVVKAGKNFELLSTNEIGEPVLASMAMTNGKLLLRTEQSLYCIQEN